MCKEEDGGVGRRSPRLYATKWRFNARIIRKKWFCLKISFYLSLIILNSFKKSEVLN